MSDLSCNSVTSLTTPNTASVNQQIDDMPGGGATSHDDMSGPPLPRRKHKGGEVTGFHVESRVSWVGV